MLVLWSPTTDAAPITLSRPCPNFRSPLLHTGDWDASASQPPQLSQQTPDEAHCFTDGGYDPVIGRATWAFATPFGTAVSGPGPLNRDLRCFRGAMEASSLSGEHTAMVELLDYLLSICASLPPGVVLHSDCTHTHYRSWRASWNAPRNPPSLNNYGKNTMHSLNTLPLKLSTTPPTRE